MNKALKLIAGAAVVVLSSPVLALNADQTFSVTATVSARCISAGAASDVNFGAYTAFVGPATATPSTNVSFRCTRGVVPSAVALDSTTGTVAGLAYTLAIGTRVDTLATTGAGVTGTFDLFTYPVNGSMATLQAGQTGAVTPGSHTLTITY